MSALAVLDAASGPGLVLGGLLTVGPCLAAVSGNPGAVGAVGAYALTLITGLAWWPDRIWGTRHLLLYLLATAAVTIVSFALARRVRHLEQATEQAQRPLRTLAALVEGSQAAVVGATLDGTVTTWNPGAERIYGYIAAEMIGMNISALAGPDGTAEFPDVLARIAAGQRVEHYETQRAHRDGTLMDISVTVSPILDEHGTVVGASAVAHDISARKRAEATQRAADVRLRILAAIVDSSDDAIIGCTLHGIVTAWNPGAERMYGYTAAEMVGNKTSVIAGPGTAGQVTNVLAQIAAGQHIEHYESQAINRDGAVLDVSVTLSPIRDADGTVVGASAVCRDISARKRAEARQRDIDERTQLAQRLQSLGQLAGGVAHDFNNLLAVILNFTAFVAEQTTRDVAVQSDLAQVRTAAERAAGLTQQLLLFSRGDTVRPEILDVNAAIAEAYAMLARTIGSDIELIAVPSPDPLMIYADSGQIQQVLVNLAVNARDAMPDGGTLVIEGTMTDLDEHQADLQPTLRPGRYARLLVSDTGTGMSKEVAARIFEPFYTTKPTGKGTGLGLATVYGIVVDAGGSLNVYSEPNLGTTFRAYFPIADESTEPPTTASDIAEPPRGHGQTVLVVDDEDAIRQVVTRILDPNGFQVLSAGGGSEALAVDARQPCELLLTDAIMPGMSGRRLAELLRRRRPGLPVLYMSGYSDGLRGTDVIIDEEFGFIEKPFTAHGLLQRIDDLMSHTEATSPANTR